MNFLQPWMLVALPAIALPVVIHLINQWRYQTVNWGAMQFLLAANRMSRGYARIRQWLILALRTLAVALLIVAVSRPLASGWMSAAVGGRADVALVLIDRSPSMQQRVAAGGLSKNQSAVFQISEALETLGARRVVLVDSVTQQPRELGVEGVSTSEPSLLDAVRTGPSDASADVPGMLLASLDYLRNNQVPNAEIWIASDLRSHDWYPSDARWSAIRDAFAEFPGDVRFRLVAYPENTSRNLTVRLTEIRAQANGQGNELLLSLQIRGDGQETGESSAVESIPVEIEINGARSVLDVEMRGGQAEVRDHRVALPSAVTKGWGRIALPADSNPADNDWFFVFAPSPTRRALVVSEDPAVTGPLELASGIAPTGQESVEALRRAPGNLQDVDWDDFALVLWHAPPPSEPIAAAIEAWVERGGRLMRFPPSSPSQSAWMGIQYGEWETHTPPLRPSGWRDDADLLQPALSGQSLPVDSLEIQRSIPIQGTATPLAGLTNGQPLLVRTLPRGTAAPRGGVYAWATTPRRDDSNLASEGVVFYVALQRAGRDGVEALSGVGSQTALRDAQPDATQWERVAGRDGALSIEPSSTAGVYRRRGDWIAINRSAEEDRDEIVEPAQIDQLFAGLPLQRVDPSTTSGSRLVREIWRLFLIAMLVALLGESLLCLPRVSRSSMRRSRSFTDDQLAPPDRTSSDQPTSAGQRGSLA